MDVINWSLGWEVDETSLVVYSMMDFGTANVFISYLLLFRLPLNLLAEGTLTFTFPQAGHARGVYRVKGLHGSIICVKQ
jgi:hypothetical protein